MSFKTLVEHPERQLRAHGARADRARDPERRHVRGARGAGGLVPGAACSAEGAGLFVRTTEAHFVTFKTLLTLYSVIKTLLTLYSVI